MRKAPVFCAVIALLLALALGGLILPDRQVSALENRVLSAAPAFSFAGFADGRWTDALETYTADQLPLRDAFVSLYTAGEALLGKRASEGVIRGAYGRLFDRTDGWKERNVALNAAALNELSAQTGLPVRLLAVPSAASVYPEAVPAFAPMADEEQLLRTAKAQVSLIEIKSALLESRRADAPLFYKTDHHWTAAGARIGYLAVCEALGLTPLAEEALQDYPGFYGSFYARFPLPWMAGDVFEAPIEASLRMEVNGEEKDGFLDADAVRGRDKYAALFYGNHPVMELTNASAPEGTLLVIKDSYANALLPALSRHFRTIVAVDARYYTGNIVDLANERKGESILCVYGLSTLASGRTIALLDGL
ncbi:MAG: hypothetical protein IKQ41_12390 [Clostridia bacterium]|nr:hypothetical protein [Clostridia bacterium]